MKLGLDKILANTALYTGAVTGMHYLVNNLNLDNLEKFSAT